MKIGFTAGAFDLLHAGHVLMFEECSSLCDYLIVGLHIDPSTDRKNKNSPVQSVVERYIQLKGLKFIDEIIPYQNESELRELLKAINLNVRFVGEDWKGQHFTGKELAENGIKHKIIYNSREHDYSSSTLREKIVKKSL
jgi:glycerol-3-phosphate cytidylyltransferase